MRVDCIYKHYIPQSFRNEESSLFFKLIGIEPTFFSVSVSEKQDDDSDSKLNKNVSSLQVVNFLLCVEEHPFAVTIRCWLLWH